MADSTPATDSDEALPSIFNAHRKAQTLVIIGSILSLLVFAKGSAWMHIPQEPGFQGSLLGQNSWVLSYIAICIMLAISALIGTIIGGRSWLFAGLFTAAVGLGGLSVRCGPLHYVLFDAITHDRSKSIFLRLAMEHCIVMIPIALIWLYFWDRFSELREKPASDADEQKPRQQSVAGDAAAVAVQVIVMVLLATILVPTDSKKQALIGIFVAGAISAALAESVSPTRNAPRWYWLGSLVVGLVGYLIAYGHPDLWTTGFAEGGLANLAHAMPLDLASAGIAGTLIGYWSAVDRPHVPFSLKARPVEKQSPNPATP
jgi:hypothetical protein